MVETVSETKLLGTIITSDLNWKKNTQSLDLKRIYMMQVRSKLEQSAVLWHFGLSQKNSNDSERVPKKVYQLE